jgi:citrate synthase
VVEERWLSAEQAAARLGVKVQTLYAYVSRGLLQSHSTSGSSRANSYDRVEVERLAARRRGGGRAGSLELLVDTRLTLLDPAGRLYFRGWDATEACSSSSYEAVAEWLWRGDDREEPPTWQPFPEALESARLSTASLPGTATSVDRMRVAVSAVATTDPLRNDRRPEAVTLAARSLIATLVECLPVLGDRTDAGDVPLRLREKSREDSIATRLWPRLAGESSASGRPLGAAVGLLNAAMVLLADHELAASTLAARVAASTWADPYLVVSTGLGALGGPLHGGASEATRALIEEAAEGTAPVEVIGRRLRSGERVPGFGHSVYRDRDPRADALLARLEAEWSEEDDWVPVRGLLDVMGARALPAPNVDFALATVCHLYRLEPGAGEAVFAVARCAGWIAHAIEEYPHRLRFRPRAVYVGSPPEQSRASNR